MAHLLARLVGMNDGWAKPFGDFNHRWLSALFRPIRPVKDFLNGTWLGHPIHALHAPGQTAIQPWPRPLGQHLSETAHNRALAGLNLG